jgi:hypothetical protein
MTLRAFARVYFVKYKLYLLYLVRNNILCPFLSSLSHQDALTNYHASRKNGKWIQWNRRWTIYASRWDRLRSRSWLFCSCYGATLISRAWYFAALPASFVSVQQSLAFRHFGARCLFSLVAILAHNAIRRVRFSLLLCTCNPGQHQNSAWLTSTMKK